MKIEGINTIAAHLAEMKLLGSRRISPTEASSAIDPANSRTSIVATPCSSRKIQKYYHSDSGALYQDEAPPLGSSSSGPSYDKLAIPVLESSDKPTSSANNFKPTRQNRKWKLKHRASKSIQKGSIKQVHMARSMRPTTSSSSTPPYNHTSSADFLHFRAPKTPAVQTSTQHCLLHLPPTPSRVRVSDNGDADIPILPKLLFLVPEMEAVGQRGRVGGHPPHRRPTLNFRRGCDAGSPSPVLKRARPHS